MNNAVDARIFLADQRGCSESPQFRSHHTFHFGAYRAEGREPFGDLYLLNDDTLRAGASLSLRVEQPSEVVLLPVTGGLEYVSEAGRGFLEPGQAGVLSLPAGTGYAVENPYEREYIRFLEIGLSRSPGKAVPGCAAFGFDWERKNTLLPLCGEGGGAFIGRYDGREEGLLPVGRGGRVFGVVLNGVFEVANRLLHAGDGLALTYPDGGTVEFEALAPDSVLVLLRV